MIRLPFSMEMVTSSVGVQGHGDREPSLRGRRPIEIMDWHIETAGRHALKVILDPPVRGCVEPSEQRSLVHARILGIEVDRELLTLIDRYRGTPTVVGCDLRNEPGSPPQDPDAPPQLGGAEWGVGGDDRDWAAAAERVGVPSSPTTATC